jgi:hypothetical protein
MELDRLEERILERTKSNCLPDIDPLFNRLRSNIYKVKDPLAGLVLATFSGSDTPPGAEVAGLLGLMASPIWYPVYHLVNLTTIASDGLAALSSKGEYSFQERREARKTLQKTCFGAHISDHDLFSILKAEPWRLHNRYIKREVTNGEVIDSERDIKEVLDKYEEVKDQPKLDLLYSAKKFGYHPSLRWNTRVERIEKYGKRINFFRKFSKSYTPNEKTLKNLEIISQQDDDYRVRWAVRDILSTCGYNPCS